MIAGGDDSYEKACVGYLNTSGLDTYVRRLYTGRVRSHAIVATSDHCHAIVATGDHCRAILAAGDRYHTTLAEGPASAGTGFTGSH